MANRNTTIVIDGTTYNIDIVDLSINGEFLYKYAQRTESGTLKTEGIGYFENQSITFKGDNNSDFVELYRLLSKIKADGTFNHDIEVFSPLGKYDFEMYPNAMNVNLNYIDQEDNYWWGEMTVRFIAIEKRVIPDA